MKSRSIGAGVTAMAGVGANVGDSGPAAGAVATGAVGAVAEGAAAGDAAAGGGTRDAGTALRVELARWAPALPTLEAVPAAAEADEVLPAFTESFGRDAAAAAAVPPFSAAAVGADVLGAEAFGAAAAGPAAVDAVVVAVGAALAEAFRVSVVAAAELAPAMDFALAAVELAGEFVADEVALASMEVDAVPAGPPFDFT
jgi:hypothetical protein